MRDIMKAIEEHKQFILNKGYNESQIFGIFAYGSMNYGLFTDKSDVDTKVIIAPTVADLAIHPIKTHNYIMENDEHCEVMDIMHWIENFKKQNINFVETLFTPYHWINPIYRIEWEGLQTMREEIYQYDPNKCIQSICGQAIHTLKQDPTNGKKLGNGMRLKYFLESYISGNDYEICIHPNEELTKNILSMKYSKFLNGADIADQLINWFEYCRTSTPPDFEVVKEAVDKELNKIILNTVYDADFYGRG